MLAALLLAGCDYQEETWIDFTDLTQITDGGFKVYSQKVDNLEKDGIPTHYIEELNDRETAVKNVIIIPLEVIVRNISAGHFSSRYGVEEGIVFEEPIV